MAGPLHQPSPTRHYEDAADCLDFLLLKAMRAITQQYNHALAPSGLLITQFSLLAMLHLSGTSAMTRFAEALGMDRTTLARNLQPLLRQDYVRLTADPVDRRVQLLTLTDAGQAILDTAWPYWQGIQTALHDTLGGERTDSLLTELHLLATFASP
ncbi:MAG: winged helix-turn-helix transcriptional regulator [Ktedonobacterales bacterium]|nr:winged helix-turn-helix transcriptional regulator [Ktedonobacterales bacterium]